MRKNVSRALYFLRLPEKFNEASLLHKFTKVKKAGGCLKDNIKEKINSKILKEKQKCHVYAFTPNKKNIPFGMNSASLNVEMDKTYTSYWLDRVNKDQHSPNKLRKAISSNTKRLLMADTLTLSRGEQTFREMKSSL